ncbi:hypothetical protein [Bradyrhizobium sp. CCGB01]|uniref:hypothetical protein n=1 Tax=Bradyrhizobium sp. CCGB01 TaxID=2949634 RepID=UPI0020B2F7B1|nr:hypothetical protein [Bradyrhizobium sp. CCGB01]MCP3404067.1 hypothetical protein [Bradyrhizobium sp. CCGB01]
MDFLGLRQANLDMMAELIPGTNNVTSYIRPFSLLSWIFWKFHGLCERAGKARPNSEEMREFRERIEVLFTWGARIEDTPGIPGKQAEPPPGGGAVPLTFKAWGRVQNSTSLIAALWYGPASKTATGLGFLEPCNGGFFRATDRGGQLAGALDGILRSDTDRYARLLDTLTPVLATEDDARALWTLWGVHSPTFVERKAFGDAVFDRSSVGNYTTLIGQRSSTIALAKLHLSQTAGAVPADDVRRGMFFSGLADGTSYPLPAELRPALRKWIVLQVRQLQRLALESLLSWCEKRVISGMHDMEALTKEAELLFRAENFGLKADDTLAAMIGGLDAQISSVESFVALGRSNTLFSPFALIDKIQAAFNARNERFAAVSLYSLLLCASFVGCFADNERAAVSSGGSSRLSLLHLRKRLSALGDVPLKQAIQFVLESMVLSQHFATAVNRFDGENQRLRLSIEEDGLISLAGKPWEPTVTEDRLPTILELASDCGLLSKAENSFHF